MIRNSGYLEFFLLDNPCWLNPIPMHELNVWRAGSKDVFFLGDKYFLTDRTGKYW